MKNYQSESLLKRHYLCDVNQIMSINYMVIISNYGNYFEAALHMHEGQNYDHAYNRRTVITNSIKARKLKKINLF
jgi:hypothetical protein